MTNTAIESPQGASVWEHDMYTYLIEHMRNEGALLEEYVRSTQGTESKALAYLVDILATDERRHHQWFADLALALKGDVELAGGDPVVPRLDLHLHDRRRTERVIEGLLQAEEHDRHELKKLRKQLRDVEDTTLWALLVDLMQLDTEKHIMMLRFAKDHTAPLS